MWNYLRNIQNKPLHTRKMILYISTVVIFSGIVLFWILLLNIQKVHESPASREGLLSPFEGIKEVFVKMFEQINTSDIPALPPEIPVSEMKNTQNPSDDTQYNGAEMSTTSIEYNPQQAL